MGLNGKSVRARAEFECGRELTLNSTGSSLELPQPFKQTDHNVAIHHCFRDGWIKYVNALFTLQFGY